MPPGEMAPGRPPGGAGGFGPPGGPGRGGPGGGGPPGGFGGLDFQYVRATLEADGTTYRDVGLRFRGRATYMSSGGGLRRPFKIDFNQFVAGQQFHGLKALSLSNNTMDPTHLREALSYAVFREAGVPAPRTAFARVYVTVPGVYDKEFAGLYTVVESVDKTFLKSRFQTNKGLLLKPQGARGFEYLGDQWRSYEERYRPKTEATAKTKRRLIEYVKLVNNADDDQFRREIGSYLDVDEFLRFLAATVLLANLDSPLAMPQNYYLHIHPTTLQVVFLPWDLDLSFGSWPMGGTPEQQSDLSISRPHTGQNRLIERLLAIKEYDTAYRQHLKQLMAGYFSVDRLGKDIETCEAVLKDIIADEAKAIAARKEPRGFGPGPMFGQSTSLKSFVAKRVESVSAQLAGKSQGQTPAGIGFGPGGGRRGGPGRGFGPGEGPGAGPGRRGGSAGGPGAGIAPAKPAAGAAGVPRKASEVGGLIGRAFTAVDKEACLDGLRTTLPFWGPSGPMLAQVVNVRLVDPEFVKAIAAGPDPRTRLYQKGSGVKVTLKNR